MDDILYILKPDSVSWQDIKDCMVKAHEPNRKKGIVMQNQSMTADELGAYLKNAYCFVALKDNKVVGTYSYIIKKVKMWWAKGDVAYTFSLAIIPEYRGTDVYFGLQKVIMQNIKKSGIRIIMSDTEEHNQIAQKLNLKKGAKLVKMYASPKTWYYSVVMARWLDGCPYSDRYCNFRYKISEFMVKTIWKPGKIIRFLPLRDSDYQKLFHHYQLCSDMISAEDFCKKIDINYNRFIRWGQHHNKI